MNILFSATRQWNPGDEFILFGCINIIKESLGNNTFNPVIYNRNPDIQTFYPKINEIEIAKFPDTDDAMVLTFANNMRIGHRDNSYKNYTDNQYVDCVVLAGSPEWSNPMIRDLFRLIKENNIPVLALGIGSAVAKDCPDKSVIKDFKLITTRDRGLVDALKEYNAKYIPCPAFLSADKALERNITGLKRIALVLTIEKSLTEINQGIDKDAYKYELDLYKKLIDMYNNVYDFYIVCHYVDELSYAREIFPELECKYSFDAKDYFEIYSNADLVISPRVHGVGICASMGIPGVVIAHDYRSNTCEGFMAEKINVGDDFSKVCNIIELIKSEISDRNKNLINHKRKTMNEYKQIVSDKLKGIADREIKEVKKPIKFNNKNAVLFTLDEKEKICNLNNFTDSLKKDVDRLDNWLYNLGQDYTKFNKKHEKLLQENSDWIYKLGQESKRVNKIIEENSDWIYKLGKESERVNKIIGENSDWIYKLGQESERINKAIEENSDWIYKLGQESERVNKIIEENSDWIYKLGQETEKINKKLEEYLVLHSELKDRVDIQNELINDIYQKISKKGVIKRLILYPITVIKRCFKH